MSVKDFSIIHTADLEMKKLLAVVENIASSRASVMIQGESGTGKELLARYIHAKSNRASKKFIAINCAAVPEGLLESELFGYEKGAFTGAERKKLGKFELANESTFLLDEISEMPLLLQAKLLRAIQEGEIERLGGSQSISINVRFICTSNKNLQKLIQKGEFREDLYYRLNVIPVEVPALRQRPKDIELLSRLFVDLCCEENGLPNKRLSSEALKKLKTGFWKGNVRELKNVIERSILLSKREEVTEQEVLIQDELNSVSEPGNILSAGMTVAEAEKRLIIKTLEHTLQNRTQAAQLLGISIRTLRNKINEYKGAYAI